MTIGSPQSFYVGLRMRPLSGAILVNDSEKSKGKG